MGQIGEELRLNRESKAISLREVEDATNIRMKYLIALEAEDFDVLPGKVYIVGFLKTYARFLGLNDEEMVVRLKSQLAFGNLQEETQEKELPKAKPRYKRKKNKSSLLIILIIVVLIIAGIAFAFLRDRDKNMTNESNPSKETPQAVQKDPSKTPDTTKTDPVEQTNNGSEINGVSVIVIVKEASCWIEVKIDGAADFQGTLDAGENRTFIGQKIISIKYGNPKVVEVIANGEKIYPVSNSGQVITKEYKEK